jgi:hypothetical protein
MCQSEQSGPFASGAGSAPQESVSMAQPAKEDTSYSVYTWDHELEKWYAQDRGATKWQLRRWLRTLYAESWDRPSILVERNG